MRQPLSEIAQKMGKTVRTQGRIFWERRDIPGAVAATRTLLEEKPVEDGICAFEGSMTPYIALALADAVFDKAQPAFVDPKYDNGIVKVPLLVPGNPRGLSFRTQEMHEFTLVDFSIPNHFLKAADLPKVVPPRVNPNKGVIISGRAVVWLTATLGLAYRNHPFVGVRESDLGAVIAIRNCTQQRKTGGVIPAEQLVLAVEGLRPAIPGGYIDEHVVAKAAAGLRTPKRGEVWFFRGPGGPHPCVVISRNYRNDHGPDVTIVPFSSKVEVHRGNRSVVILRAGTQGMTEDSAVLCHRVTTIGKNDLMGEVVGMLSDADLENIILHVRYAIGDFGHLPEDRSRPQPAQPVCYTGDADGSCCTTDTEAVVPGEDLVQLDPEPSDLVLVEPVEAPHAQPMAELVVLLEPTGAGTADSGQPGKETNGGKSVDQHEPTATCDGQCRCNSCSGTSDCRFGTAFDAGTTGEETVTAPVPADSNPS